MKQTKPTKPASTPRPRRRSRGHVSKAGRNLIDYSDWAQQTGHDFPFYFTPAVWDQHIEPGLPSGLVTWWCISGMKAATAKALAATGSGPGLTPTTVEVPFHDKTLLAVVGPNALSAPNLAVTVMLPQERPGMPRALQPSRSSPPDANANNA